MSRTMYGVLRSESEQSDLAARDPPALTEMTEVQIRT